MGEFLFKIIRICILIFLIVGICYIILDYRSEKDIVEVYNKVGSTKNMNIKGMKKLNFLSTYVKETGEYSIAVIKGYEDTSLVENTEEFVDDSSQDEQNNENSEEQQQQQSPNNQTGVNNITVTSSITSDDLTEAAKAICQAYIANPKYNDDGSLSEAYYSNGPGKFYYGHPYPSVTYNGRTLPPYSTQAYHRCCNGLVCGVLYLAGYDYGNTIFLSCLDIINKIGKPITNTIAENSNLSFSDLEVGDIIGVGNGSSNSISSIAHVEIVVKKEGNNVYVATAGNDKPIKVCAEQGYNRLESSKKISCYYGPGWWERCNIVVVRRP